MDAALSFDRVWVRLVSRREGHWGHEQQQCDCLDFPVPEDGPPIDRCNKCHFVAAEVGVTETVADLKSMLLELLPTCFYTHYDLVLRRKTSHLSEGPTEGPLVLHDSCSFAKLSVRSGEVIDLVPKTWDPRSSFLHLKRLAEVLYDPKAIVMRQLPDAADPCGAFGALLRPVVLQQLAATSQKEGARGSCDQKHDDKAPTAAAGGATEAFPAGRRHRSNRRKARSEKGRQKVPDTSPWGGNNDERLADALHDCSLFWGNGDYPLGAVQQQHEQFLLLRQSLLPSQLKTKPKVAATDSSCPPFCLLPSHIMSPLLIGLCCLCVSALLQLLSFIRIFPGSSPTPAAQLAGHVLWAEAETLEGLRLFIAGTEKGFCVSSLRKCEGAFVVVSLCAAASPSWSPAALWEQKLRKGGGRPCFSPFVCHCSAQQSPPQGRFTRPPRRPSHCASSPRRMDALCPWRRQQMNFSLTPWRSCSRRIPKNSRLEWA